MYLSVCQGYLRLFVNFTCSVFSVVVQGRDAGQKMQASLLECVLRAERAQNIVGQMLDHRVKLSRAECPARCHHPRSAQANAHELAIS